MLVCCRSLLKPWENFVVDLKDYRTYVPALIEHVAEARQGADITSWQLEAEQHHRVHPDVLQKVAVTVRRKGFRTDGLRPQQRKRSIEVWKCGQALQAAGTTVGPLRSQSTSVCLLCRTHYWHT